MPNAFLFKILPFLYGVHLILNGVTIYVIELLILIENPMKHMSIKKVSAFLPD